MIPVNNGSLSLWNTIMNVLQASEHQWSNKTLYFFILCPLLHIGDFNRHHSRSHSRKHDKNHSRNLDWKQNQFLVYDTKDAAKFHSTFVWSRVGLVHLGFLFCEMFPWKSGKQLMMRLAKPDFPGLNQISIDPTGRYFQLKRRTILEGLECSIQGVL